MRTIIFLSGLGVPNIISKSYFVWNDPIWSGYRRIYLRSPIPTSDKMTRKYLETLIDKVNSYPDVIVAGQSLGAWWAANLACQTTCKMKKVILLSPLIDANVYPIFGVSQLYHPINWKPKMTGPHQALVLSGSNDLIVPPSLHAEPIKEHLNALHYPLDGGHFYQDNHQEALRFIKNWIEIK